jgi:hypothetical protein
MKTLKFINSVLASKLAQPDLHLCGVHYGHSSGPTTVCTIPLMLRSFTVLVFYKSVSGPEGSSPGADFTYSLLDSYVTPQINEGPGFCRCKRGPVVNILPPIGAGKLV